jgi:hypothetical protein
MCDIYTGVYVPPSTQSSLILVYNSHGEKMPRGHAMAILITAALDYGSEEVWSVNAADFSAEACGSSEQVHLNIANKNRVAKIEPIGSARSHAVGARAGCLLSQDPPTRPITFAYSALN